MYVCVCVCWGGVVLFILYGWFGRLCDCWSSANRQKKSNVRIILLWVDLIGFSYLAFTYCICGWLYWCSCCCWGRCISAQFTRCYWSGRLRARRKTSLTHWLLANLTDFQLQTLLVRKYINMFHLQRKKYIYTSQSLVIGWAQSW